MKIKNFIFGREKELFEHAEKFEKSFEEGNSIYLDANDWADLADWYHVRKKEELALQAVNQGLKEHPDNTSLLVEKSYIYLDSDEFEKAKELASSIQDNNSDELKILKANLCMLNDDFDQAEILIDSIKSRDNLPNIIEIIYLYLDNNVPEKAWDWLQIGKTFKDEQAYMVALGDYYCYISKYKEAKKLFNKLIDLNPYCSQFWYSLAMCYFETEDYEKAIEACDFSIVSDEEFGPAYRVRGGCYFALDNIEKAVEDFKIAYKFHSMEAESYHIILGNYYAEKKEWKQALECYSIAIDNNNNYSLEKIIPLFFLCYTKVDEEDSTCKEIAKARKTLSTLSLDSFIDCLDMIKSGEKEEAMQLLQSLSKDIKSDPTTLFELGVSFLTDCNFELARNTFEKVYKLDPSYPNVHNCLAFLYMLFNDREKFDFHNKLCKQPINDIMYEEGSRLLKELDREKIRELFNNYLSEGI